MKVLRWIDNGIEKVSSYGLVVAVVLMLFFSCLSIVLRWFNTNFLWLDPFVRHMVFIATFLGGVLATGKRTHIGIDILGKYLENHKNYFWLGIIQQVISLISFLTLIGLVYACYIFAQSEFEFGQISFWGIHTGFLVSIIPVGFGLIAYRFFFLFVSSLGETKKGEESTENKE